MKQSVGLSTQMEKKLNGIPPLMVSGSIDPIVELPLTYYAKSIFDSLLACYSNETFCQEDIALAFDICFTPHSCRSHFYVFEGNQFPMPMKRID